MRKSILFLVLILSNGLLLVLLLVLGFFRVQADLPMLQQMGLIVRNLEITDLCLSTEAWYTRHLSLADWHTPFQDHPLALEHFPTGSLLGPPAMMRKANGQVD